MSESKHFDEYLRGQSDLSRSYRQSATDGPPAELDQRILEQAALAVRTQQHPKPAGRPSGPFGGQRYTRWSLAAVLVLTVSVVALLPDERPDDPARVRALPRVSDAPAPATKPVSAPAKKDREDHSQEMPRQPTDSQSGLQKRSDNSATPAAPVSEDGTRSSATDAGQIVLPPVPHAADEVENAIELEKQRKIPEIGPDQRPPLVQPEAHRPVGGSVEALREQAPDTPSSAAQPGQPSAATEKAAASQVPSGRMTQSPAPANRAERDEKRSLTGTRGEGTSNEGPSEPETRNSRTVTPLAPEEWIAQILTRLDAGDLAGARALMIEFRGHYPHFEIDSDITDRLGP